MERKEIIREAAGGVRFDEEFGRVRDLVKRHRVCWEVWPEYHIDRENRKVQIGFELDLIGTHHDPQNPPEPGCDECLKVYKALKEIAQWVIPKEERASWYEVGIFDFSIHYSAQRRFRGEVLLPIKILHREGFHRPTDECEMRCLTEMETKLKALGAQRERWMGGFAGGQ